ncbi:MAG: hypothetical protein MZU91_11490 [Desulfosudis oleivorans]|nr:hypothetical protein [Desulfosudis oleivorans]
MIKVGPDARRQGRPRGHGRSGRQRVRPAQPGLGRGQPPQGGQAERRAAGLRLAAGHRRRRLHELQPLLLRPDRQGGRGRRRALQPGRSHRRLHHRLHAPAAHGLLRRRATAPTTSRPWARSTGPRSWSSTSTPARAAT